MESSVNARLPEMTGHSVLHSKWNGFSNYEYGSES